MMMTIIFPKDTAPPSRERTLQEADESEKQSKEVFVPTAGGFAVAVGKTAAKGTEFIDF